MKKKIGTLLLISTLVLCLLVGCGKKSGGNASNNSVGDKISTTDYEVTLNSVTFKDSFDYYVEDLLTGNDKFGYPKVIRYKASYSGAPESGKTVAIIDFTVNYIGKEKTTFDKDSCPEIVYGDGYNFKNDIIFIYSTLDEVVECTDKNFTPVEERKDNISDINKEYENKQIDMEPLQSSNVNCKVCILVPKEVETGSDPLVVKLKFGEDIVGYKVR